MIKEKNDIKTQAKTHALDIVIALTELVTLICFIKGNPAWKGGLFILFSGIATVLFYRYLAFSKKPYFYTGLVFGSIAIVLFIWFGMSI